jgi:uncharacterized protein
MSEARPSADAGTQPAPATSLSTPTSLLIGLTGGVLSGLLGIGGGTVMVPLMVLLGGLSQRKAHAISLGAIVPIAAVAVTTYALAGEIDWGASAALTVGTIFGAQAGAGFLARIPERRLKIAFGVFLIFAALALLIGG